LILYHIDLTTIAGKGRKQKSRGVGGWGVERCNAIFPASFSKKKKN
jgi:hypothetical protein